MTIEEGALERLRARLHQVLQKARVEEVQLPLKENRRSGDISEDEDDEVIVVSLFAFVVFIHHTITFKSLPSTPF